MNWYEKTIFGLGLYVKKLGSKLKAVGHRLRDFAMELHAQRIIDSQLPPQMWREDEPWHDNFSTRAGEHDHV